MPTNGRARRAAERKRSAFLAWLHDELERDAQIRPRPTITLPIIEALARFGELELQVIPHPSFYLHPDSVPIRHRAAEQQRAA